MTYRLIVVLLFLSFQLTAEKHALLIGLGTYPQGSGWQDLSSDNDLYHVQACLELKGFSTENIMTVRNEAATYDGIIKSFDILSQRLSVGDFVFIHYSGHGQQVVDDNNDEIDGLDEAMVPYDSPLKYEQGKYEGELLLRDDKINDLIVAIRQKLGPEGQVILVMDSCHSGTGTRGRGVARGTDVIMGANPATSPSADLSYGLNTKAEANLAPLFSLFGASANELNYETIDSDYKNVGSLSYATSQVLVSMDDLYNFQELYNRVRLKMMNSVPNQNPRFEGDGNQVIFKNEKTNKDWFVNYINQDDDGAVNIATGTLQGVFNGSKVSLYSPEEKKVVAKGVVSMAGLKESRVSLNSSFTIPQASLIMIKVDEKANPPHKLNMNFSTSENSEWGEVVEMVQELSYVSSSNSYADLYLSECSTPVNALQLLTKEGDVIYEATADKGMGYHKYQIKNILKSSLISGYLRELEVKNKAINFEVDLILLNKDGDKQKLDTRKDDCGNISLKVGDEVKFRIKNTGTIAAYFNLLDIQPDNKVNLVIPNNAYAYTADDFYLEPGQTFVTPFVSKIYPPFGNEVLKIVGSLKPIDFSEVLVGQGAVSRGADKLNHIEKMLVELYGETRGATPIYADQDISVASFMFTIDN